MKFNTVLEAELLTQDFKNMYVRWGRNTPPRTGLHASAVLAKDSEWCLRQHVLAELHSEQGEAREWNTWDWKRAAIFENGWRLHQRWQDIFLKCGNVVWTPLSSLPPQDIPPHHLKMINGEWHAAELDLTHYDAERNLYFSPDAILQFGGETYVVEIKGIKQESYLSLPDDLQGACAINETIAHAREQVNLYQHLLLIQRGIILIENKSNQDFRLWIWEYEKERAWPYTNRLQDIKARTFLVRTHGESKLPVRCCQSASDRRAQTCPMRTVCFFGKD